MKKKEIQYDLHTIDELTFDTSHPIVVGSMWKSLHPNALPPFYIKEIDLLHPKYTISNMPDKPVYNVIIQDGQGEEYSGTFCDMMSIVEKEYMTVEEHEKRLGEMSNFWAQYEDE